eukprot:scaffold3471_cov202-Prasinococcus_capsulatus_cf.AAC.1
MLLARAPRARLQRRALSRAAGSGERTRAARSVADPPRRPPAHPPLRHAGDVIGPRRPRDRAVRPPCAPGR